MVCTLYMYKIDFQIHPTLIDISPNAMSSAALFTKPCGFTSSVEPSTVPLYQFMLVTTNKTESRPIHISCDVFLVLSNVLYTICDILISIIDTKMFSNVYSLLKCSCDTDSLL